MRLDKRMAKPMVIKTHDTLYFVRRVSLNDTTVAMMCKTIVMKTIVLKTIPNCRFMLTIVPRLSANISYNLVPSKIMVRRNPSYKSTFYP